MSNGNDIDSIFGVTINKLEGELLDAATLMSRVDPRKPFWIIRDLSKRGIDSDAKFTASGRASLCIPISRTFQLSSCFRVKVDPHRQPRAF
jgi:hypothetical protein